MWRRKGDKSDGDVILFPTCRVVERPPTVGRCEVDGHGEIELCPGGRWKISSIRVEQSFSVKNASHLHRNSHIETISGSRCFICDTL